MVPKKTLRQREQELQALLPTPEGKLQLEALAARYAREGGGSLVEGTSLITYILVRERDLGLITL